ncbi:MAG TPA: serine/threonine protein kinase, partial [Anaerolineae bacterium]|nr:serine/threonine protein kinase [Anaerolineae bacterium]
NIKLTPESRLKLVDFGLAKPFDPGDPRTVTGLQGLGSLPYTPLEQYVGHIGHTDARADLYALGATCYHLLTGQSPASAHDRFLNPKALTPPESLNPHISLPTSQAILQAMALHPNDRPASVEDWRVMLVAKTATRPVTAKSARAGATSPHPPASSSFIDILKENALLFGIALLLFILAVVMTFSQ